MTRRHAEPLIQIELLRFLCAVAVMGAHYFSGFWYAPGHVARNLLGGYAFRPADRFGFEFGWVGVQIFFVISGAMIARSAVRVAQAQFVRSRILRLVPAAWVCATITIAALAAMGIADRAMIKAWARSFAFLSVGEQVDPAYWTIGIEVSFYLLVAVVMGPRGRADRLDLIALGLTSASLAAAFSPFLGATHDPTLPSSRASDLLLLTHGSFFAIGILIAQIQDDRPTLGRLATIGLACIPSSMQIIEQTGVSSAEAGRAISPAIALAVAGAGIVLIASAGRAQALLARWIKPDHARWFGRLTYPLYLLHQNVGAVAISLLLHLGMDVVPAILVAAVSVIAAAATVAAWLEPFVARRIRLWLDTLDARIPFGRRKTTIQV